jgi:hypothetical protein
LPLNLPAKCDRSLTRRADMGCSMEGSSGFAQPKGKCCFNESFILNQ